jgi:hypothetical protein
MLIRITVRSYCKEAHKLGKDLHAACSTVKPETPECPASSADATAPFIWMLVSPHPRCRTLAVITPSLYTALELVEYTVSTY